MALADTIWTPNTGNGDYTVSTPADIVDPLSVFLVDPIDGTTFVADTGATYLPVPLTVWSSNEGT